MRNTLNGPGVIRTKCLSFSDPPLRPGHTEFTEAACQRIMFAFPPKDLSGRPGLRRKTGGLAAAMAIDYLLVWMRVP